MSLKQKVKAMRVVLGTRPCKHGYDLQQVIGTLYRYIDELESQSSQPVSVDDVVKVTASKKKPEAAKRTPAKKKAPAKKAPAKKATKSKS